MPTYDGKKLIKNDYKALKDLEQLIGKRIPSSHYANYDFGFDVQNRRVVKLAIAGPVIKYPLSRKRLKKLPSSIENLTALKELDLSYNQLSSFLKSSPDKFTNLLNLQKLYISKNRLSTLPSSIKQLKNLKVLWIYGNKFTELPEWIWDIKSLKGLYLSNNKLTKLSDKIGRLTGLLQIDLEKNNLKALPVTIGNLILLQELWIQSNKLKFLPDSIGNLKSLKILYCSNNKLNTVPESIGNLTLLEVLDLSGNNLYFIDDPITKLTSLKKLYLNNNQLTSLPEPIGNLKLLEKLFFFNNKISNLPTSIYKLHSTKIKKDEIKKERKSLEFLNLTSGILTTLLLPILFQINQYITNTRMLNFFLIAFYCIFITFYWTTTDLFITYFKYYKQKKLDYNVVIYLFFFIALIFLYVIIDEVLNKNINELFLILNIIRYSAFLIPLCVISYNLIKEFIIKWRKFGEKYPVIKIHELDILDD